MSHPNPHHDPENVRIADDIHAPKHVESKKHDMARKLPKSYSNPHTGKYDLRYELMSHLKRFERAGKKIKKIKPLGKDGLPF